MKTIISVVYDDVTDTTSIRYVQGTKYGNTDAEITANEKNNIESFIKRLEKDIKKKPNAFATRSVQVQKKAVVSQRPPSIPLCSRWTYNNIIIPVTKAVNKVLGKEV